MTYRALVPVKALSTVKSRLAAHLTPQQREDLVLDMLSHVIHALCASNTLECVSVVSPDQHVLAYAHAWGARPLLEEQAGHNPALSAAAERELASGATALLTISADLPLLRPQEIRELIAQSREHDVVLAPSREGTGTNALLVRPPLALPYLFGPQSLQHYILEAQRRDLRYTLYHGIGLALDIDTVDDLNQLHFYEKQRVHVC